MIVITPELLVNGYIAILFLAIGIIVGGLLVAWWEDEPIKAVEPQPIDYPETEMDKAYLAVATQIKNAKNPTDLYASYSSIMKFKNDFFGDEDYECGALEQLYNQREEAINKTARMKSVAWGDYKKKHSL